uniref:Uncharacterized protein n=1 Tax=virus sp. ct9pU4 TaxID=2828248 RepID=A0A8S5RBV3_9VIRU|nr:MAG TPA: hypothetical protein [virus sp. ct9pU4]
MIYQYEPFLYFWLINNFKLSTFRLFNGTTIMVVVNSIT